MLRPDLDAPEHIDRFVDDFYARVLADPQLAPLFLDVAGVDLAVHLPRIKAYWRKMLLGEQGYRRHMMRKHRELDARQPLTADDYARWLALFEDTLNRGYSGPVSERARGLARRVAANMRQNLAMFR
jgi:hemoglobin